MTTTTISDVNTTTIEEPTAKLRFVDRDHIEQISNGVGIITPKHILQQLLRVTTITMGHPIPMVKFVWRDVPTEVETP